MSATQAQSTFVGRSDELEALAAMLIDRARLITILGPPGMGKTRIALQLGERTRPRFAADFLPVDLTPCRSLQALESRVADALELTGAERSARIPEALRSRGRFLLVLDNFEQVAADGAARIADWLNSAPALRIVVTSRERLRIQAERLFELPPLPIDSDAVTLFMDRAA
ncbi:MAG: putative ATPase, partial [Myxococcota bacterium]